MIEIELKAHVYDVTALVAALSGWAVFKKCCHKDDTYWKDSRRQIQVRIRGERILFSQDSLLNPSLWPQSGFPAKEGGILSTLSLEFERGQGKDEQVFVTYKRKKLVDGSLEVNQEQEFQVDRREPLEVFLQDAGFSPHLRKEKLVASWEWEDVTLELCFIPGLGNFLELEILSPGSQPQMVADCHNKLRGLLSRCGIEESAIEGRFYSQLLEEVRGRG